MLIGNLEVYGIIYKITNKVNSKIYIGQTVRNFDKRYKNNLEKYTHNNYLKNSIKKYGIENFKIDKEIDKAYSIEELNDKETCWIKYYDCISPKGYNICVGGLGTSGYHHTEETKIRQRDCKMGMYLGETNPFFGKTHSDETKARWSEKRSGKGLSEEWRKHISEAQYKKVINLDTGEVFNSVKAAAEKYGLKDTHISRVCKGKRNKTGGYRWKHYKDYLKSQEIIS